MDHTWAQAKTPMVRNEPISTKVWCWAQPDYLQNAVAAIATRYSIASAAHPSAAGYGRLAQLLLQGGWWDGAQGSDTSTRPDRCHRHSVRGSSSVASASATWAWTTCPCCVTCPSSCPPVTPSRSSARTALARRHWSKLLSRLYDPTSGTILLRWRRSSSIRPDGLAQSGQRHLPGFCALRSDGTREHRLRPGRARQ